MSLKFISFKEVMPKLYKVFPGWIKEEYCCITSYSGAGKTNFAKFLGVIHSYRYCKKHNIPLKILYFALEESVEKFWITIQSEMLNYKYNKSVTYYQYIGAHEGLTDDIKKKFAEFDDIINDMKKYIHVYNVSNPTGMYKACKEELLKLGTLVKNEEDFKPSTFTYHNPDTMVLVIVDHVSLITPEKHDGVMQTQHQAMGYWSKNYAMKELRDLYKCVIINVQQQGVSEDNKTNQKNGLTEPQQNGLGNNKELLQDYSTMLSLYNPFKYGGETVYKGMDFSKFKRNFRTLSVLKHRNGEADYTIPLFFRGSVSYFEEIELRNGLITAETQEKYYNIIKNDKFDN